MGYCPKESLNDTAKRESEPYQHVGAFSCLYSLTRSHFSRDLNLQYYTRDLLPCWAPYDRQAKTTRDVYTPLHHPPPPGGSPTTKIIPQHRRPPLPSYKKAFPIHHLYYGNNFLKSIFGVNSCTTVNSSRILSH